MLPFRLKLTVRFFAKVAALALASCTGTLASIKDFLACLNTANRTPFSTAPLRSPTSPVNASNDCLAEPVKVPVTISSIAAMSFAVSAGLLA